MSDPVPTQAHVREAVNAVLDAYFQEKCHAARVLSPLYGELWEAITSLGKAGGKRLRPYMVVLAYGALTPAPFDTCVYELAAAQEIMHLALLIHDDISDRDTIRYGIKNITGRYEEVYEQYITDVTERHHYANSAALLAGDVLISSSYELIGQIQTSATNIVQMQHVLNEAYFAAAGGQLIDIETAFRTQPAVTATVIARYKTASYTCVSPLHLGAMLAQADESVFAHLERCGIALGVAFQFRDDLLEVFGEDAQTGQSTIGDIRDGKRTRLIELFEQQATDAQKQAFFAIFHHQHIDDQMIHRVRQLLDDSGARGALERTINELASEATRELDALPITGVYREAFEDLITRCTQRSM